MDKLQKCKFKLAWYKFLGNKKKVRKYLRKISTYKEEQRWMCTPKTIKKYKYIHIMNNGLHSVTILEFIQKHFDNKEHCFIFPLLF